MILIDTDICIEILRGNKAIIEKRKNFHEEIAISFMSVAELFYGAEKSEYRNKNYILIEEFLLSVNIINSDVVIMKKFGELKAHLYSTHSILPDADIFIASTALLKCTALVTGNTKHFIRIPGLRIENWKD